MVGKKIRAYREFRGYSQIQLAELSGINVGTIRKYELGIRNPKPDQLEKIATALGLNVSVFLDFNIETVGDVLSLLFSIDDSVTLSLAETPDQKVELTFDNPTMQDFFRKWCQFKNVYKKEKAEILAIEDEDKRQKELDKLNATQEERVQLKQKLLQAKRVYIAGMGRSGLIAGCFAMRLAQLGLQAMLVGETTVTAIQPGDLLLIDRKSTRLNSSHQ